MTVSKPEPVCITGRPNSDEKRSVPFKDTIRRRPTLKELQDKKYMFPDSNSLGILDDLLDKVVIQLPKPKSPQEVGRTADSKYCCYHRTVSPPLEKCKSHSSQKRELCTL